MTIAIQILLNLSTTMPQPLISNQQNEQKLKQNKIIETPKINTTRYAFGYVDPQLMEFKNDI